MDKLGVGTFINSESELTTSSLDIFSTPPVDATLKDGKTVYYYPLNAISDSGPFDFIIPKDPDSWTVLNLTRLEGEIELIKKDGTDFAATDLVSVVNLFPQSLHKQIEVELNGVQVCDLSSPTHAWKVYIETVLTYGRDAKESHLLTSLYLKDTETHELRLTGAGAFKARREKLISNKFHFSTVIHSDFFQSQTWLFPNNEVKLKFIRNADEFSLLGEATFATKFRLGLKNLKLSVRRVQIDPAVDASIEAKLLKTPAIYTITQSKIKVFVVPTGTTTVDFPSILQGNLPRHIIFGFVNSKGFNGTIDGNPYYFNHQNVNLFNLKINGSPVVPTPFTPDFAGNNYTREYRWFCDNLGIHHENETNGITRTEYMNNTCFWPFDLTPDMCNGFHVHKTKQGNMDLSLGFKEATTENLHMLVYGSFNSAIQIDHLRNVVVLD